MKATLSVVLVTTSLLPAVQVAVAQHNPHGQLPVTSLDRPYLLLIRDPVVHDDLKLSAQQRAAVKSLNGELDGELWSMRNKSAEHIAETMQRATATARARLSSVLSREQQQRLAQIELWTLGTRAFLRDELPQKLGLSADQRQKVRAAVTKTQEAINDLSKQLPTGGSREALEKEALTLRTDEQRQILAALSREQQQQWIALLGERIDVSKLGRVKFKAPELHGRESWVNSPPLTLRQLKGKVVALHFYAFA
jgi:hypothetical protein